MMAQTPKPAPKLGKRLRQLRLDAGRTQEEIAAASGIPVGHYQKLEYGLLDVKYTTLRKLAKAFSVPLSQLFEE